MYARQVSMNLKPNSTAGFTQKLETQVIPLLRKQKGFKDEITFVNPTGKDAVAVSLWDSKDSAEAYGRDSYTEVNKLLADVVEGTPQIRTFEIANSTCHKIAASSPAA
jgi:heme-degrading monooxygenase HmoA